MRYFLDTEFNGFGGALLSLALVPEDGDQELYLTFQFDGDYHPWVEKHVVPFLDHVPAGLACPRTGRGDGALAVAHYLGSDPAPVIVADWPEDISLFCQLLMPAAAEIVPVPSLTFRFIRLPGFSVAANSRVPHNALHDARALREHIVANDY